MIINNTNIHILKYYILSIIIFFVVLVDIFFIVYILYSYKMSSRATKSALNQLFTLTKSGAQAPDADNCRIICLYLYESPNQLIFISSEMFVDID